MRWWPSTQFPGALRDAVVGDAAAVAAARDAVLTLQATLEDELIYGLTR